MCKAKPGPRCSKDALQTYRSAHSKTVAAKQELDEFVAQLDASGGNGADDQWDYEQLSAAYQLYKKRSEEAEMMYDTTPDGEASLRRLTTAAGDAKVMKTVRYMGHSSDKNSMEVQYMGELDVPVSRKSMLEARLASALSFRNWQAQAGASLEKADPEAGVFIAEGLKSEMWKTIQERQKSTTQLNSQIEEHAESQRHHLIPPLLVQKYSNDLAVKYGLVGVVDLDAYIGKHEKKAAQREVIPARR